MFHILYAAVCIALANLPYKPRAMKARIEKSLAFAVFVAVWMLLFVILFFVPAWKFLTVNYSWLPIFIITTVLWFASPWLVRQFGKRPTKIEGDIGKTFLMDFKPHAFAAKYFEILCQQGLFVYILFVILRGLSLPLQLFWFLLFIVLVHLANIPFMEKKHALMFTYWSIPMAIVFGYLILNGYILVTISIHMLFYVLFNGRYWFKKAEIL